LLLIITLTLYEGSDLSKLATEQTTAP